jgi:hypothetical protein
LEDPATEWTAFGIGFATTVNGIRYIILPAPSGSFEAWAGERLVGVARTVDHARTLCLTDAHGLKS